MITTSGKGPNKGEGPQLKGADGAVEYNYDDPINIGKYPIVRNNLILNVSEGDYPELYPDLFGSADQREGAGEEEGLDATWITVIIIGSVLFFLLICVVLPCIIECRKCRREGHCCCLCCKSKEFVDDDDDEVVHHPSKAQLAGYKSPSWN